MIRAESGERDRIPAPPRGLSRLTWLGPGVLWMVAAMGSGELLFTPRIAAQYGYALLWAFIAAVTLKWFVNRELGRFAVCTGQGALTGFALVPGPRNWAVWTIVLPQLLVAASAIAGLASAGATALILLLPGPLWLWTMVPLLVSGALVFWGRYGNVELATKLFALVLAVAALAAAVSSAPSPSRIAEGIVPGLPESAQLGEILPWLGYALSGAAGLLWYSYWIVEKGYGAAGASGSRTPRAVGPHDAKQVRSLRGWISQMTLDTTVAVVGAVVITLAFMVLGAELLRPRRLVPEEREMARTLGTMLEPVWGRVGFWVMVGGVFVGFWGTLLSNQDGFSRMFANGTRILAEPLTTHRRWRDEAFLRRCYVAVWVTVVPAVLFLAVGEPVTLLKIAGTIEACHIPVVTALVLYLNLKHLPPELRPSWASYVPTAVAAAFFATFAVLYVVQLATRGSG